MQKLSRTTADSVTMNYTKSNTHPSANFPRVRSGASGGMTLGQGHSRSVK